MPPEEFDRNPGPAGALIYLPILLAGTLPWSAAWWDRRHLRSGILSKVWWQRLPSDPADLWLACWIVIPMLVLVLASSKLGLYALPVFAPMAILCARLWSRPIERTRSLPGEPRPQAARPASEPATPGPWPWPTAHPRRAMAWLGLWIAVLLGGRLILAYWPTDNDMRALWATIKDRLPEGNYELCTVDDRADGLLFYAPVTLEHLTDEPRPYPTYTKTEHVLAELIDPAQQNEKIVLLIRTKKKNRQVSRLLQEANVPYHAMPLGRGRSLIIPDPPGPSAGPSVL